MLVEAQVSYGDLEFGLPSVNSFCALLTGW